MKKALIILISALAVSLNVSAKSPDSKFSLAVSTGPYATGYISTTTNGGTLFWNLALTPDWRFNAHWGMAVDLESGYSIAGDGAADIFSTFHSELRVSPYFEWEFDKWYIDVMAGPFARYRLLYYGEAPLAMVGQTISIGSSASFRAGVAVGRRTDIFGCFRLESEHYNPEAEFTNDYTKGRVAGNIQLVFGVRVRLSK